MEDGSFITTRKLSVAESAASASLIGLPRGEGATNDNNRVVSDAINCKLLQPVFQINHVRRHAFSPGNGTEQYCQRNEFQSSC